MYNANELSLPLNYRSTNTILEAAKCFLKNDDKLRGVRETGNKIVVRNHYNPFNEALYLVEEIKKLHEKGIEYREIAIFYRLQKQSIAFEEAFSRAGIPFEVSIRKTLKDIPILNWFALLLKASINPCDTHSIILVLIAQFGGQLTVPQAKEAIVSPTSSGSSLIMKIRNFSFWCESNSSPEAVLYLDKYFDINNLISPTSSLFVENRKLIDKFINEIYKYLVTKKLDLYKGIREYLFSSSLYGIDFLQDEININHDSVKLTTLHACKGLEFKYVYIIGANLGYIPLKTTSEDEEDEEKRLFFVGITRTKDFLEISYYTSPEDPRVTPGPSPYISLISNHLIRSVDNTFQEGDLQELRKKVKANLEQRNSFSFAEKMPVEPTCIIEQTRETQRQVRHKKYGVGHVLSEDDNLITVEFIGYGIKSFSKIFSELEFI